MHKITYKHLPVTIWFTTSREKYQKKTQIDLAINCVGNCSYDLSMMSVCIGVFNEDIGTFAHELFHAIQDINTLISSDINQQTQEHNAYLFGNITKRCYKIFVKECKEGIKY